MSCSGLGWALEGRWGDEKKLGFLKKCEGGRWQFNQIFRNYFWFLLVKEKGLKFSLLLNKKCGIILKERKNLCGFMCKFFGS